MEQIINEKELADKIVSDRKVRTAITSESHYWFFNVYFSHYVKYPTAQFQREMFSLTEQEEINNVVIVAFRSSAKSSIMTLSYPIWSILGKPKKKFVVILGQTQAKARQHLINLKREFESNDLLKADLGPFEECDEWGSYSLVLPKFGARVSSASSEQSIRGLRHGENRPDLIICDDVEDLVSVKTREGRDKIYDWLTGDVIPAGDKNTRLIVIGNLLHEDSLLMRLKQNISENKLNGVFKAYPLINGDGQISWPGKFASMAEIEELKQATGNDIAWQREYCLKIVPDTDQIIKPEWVQYYDELLSDKEKDYRYIKTGVDLAISEKDSADFTAMVSAKVFGYGKDLKIYILPEIVNIKAEFPKVIERIKELLRHLGNGKPTGAYVESNAYQAAVSQYLAFQNYPITGVISKGDKRSRAISVTHLIQNGTIRFPKHGADQLIEQLVYFGVEKHDDLVDAFVLLINKILEDSYERVAPEILWF